MYRKFTADLIFTGQEMLPPGKVVVMDDHRTVVEIVDTEMAGGEVEKLTGLLAPGFINAHCHLELSHLKGAIPEQTGLVGFVQQVMQKREATAEEKSRAMEEAEEELFAGGTVAVGDICNTTDSIAVKEKSRLRWHNFIESSGFVDAVAEKRLQPLQEVLAEFRSALPGQQSSLSPHSPYSVSRNLFSRLNEETGGQIVTIHNQEAEAENDLYRDKSGGFLKLYENLGVDLSGFMPTGKTSLESWLPYFTNDQSLVLVHNLYTDQGDIEFMQQFVADRGQSLFLCLCPNANQFIEGRMPPVELLRSEGCNIILGTDSYASNRQLSVFEEIKTILLGPGSAIPLEEILKWGTFNGARALRMNDELGSFEKGKKPGLVLIEQMEGENIGKLSKARRIF